MTEEQAEGSAEVYSLMVEIAQDGVQKAEQLLLDDEADPESVMALKDTMRCLVGAEILALGDEVDDLGDLFDRIMKNLENPEARRLLWEMEENDG